MESKLYDNVVRAPFGHGQLKSGVADGANDLYSIISSMYHVNNNLTYHPMHTKHITPEGEWKYDYEYLRNLLFDLPTYVLFGGDHSVGQSSVGASLKKIVNIDDLVVIWIDAHPDSNTYESSESKNYHGMPLAGILGYEEPWFKIDKKLPSTNLLYYGIRDADKFEDEKIKEDNIFSTNDHNILIDKIDKIIDKNNNVKFHVSFDVDSLDPEFMTSTGCVVEGGLNPMNVVKVINHVIKRVIALDIVEFNPTIGDREKSVDTLKNILSSIEF